MVRSASKKARSIALVSLSVISTGLFATNGLAGSAVAQVRAVAVGGSMTVLEPSVRSWATGLGTYTNAQALQAQSLMDAIYGQLFQIGADGKTAPDLASGWTLSKDAKTLTIDIRKGVVFSDGTPFDASAVAKNFNDDLASTLSKTDGDPAIPVQSITTPNDHTVVIHMSGPDSAAVNQFQDSLFNWIASPAAEQKLGPKQFALTPVAAGPFTVTSDTLSSKLVLQRNPHYWETGHPYLDSLTFLVGAGDQTDLEALESGSAQAAEEIETPSVVSSFKSAGLQITLDKGDGSNEVQINSTVAPFNNLKARQAIYYATNSKAIDNNIDGGTCPVAQSFQGPEGLFYQKTIPGYLTYNLAKAQALVQQLGGLTFTLNVPANAAIQGEAVEAMYKAAGMTVTLNTLADFTAENALWNTHTWQAIQAGVNAWDPAGGIDLNFILQSTAAYTGVKDPKVDALLAQGTSAPAPAARAKVYSQLAEYLAKNAYLPFTCSPSSWDATVKGVSGPGLTTDLPGGDVGPQPLWADVSMSK